MLSSMMARLVIVAFALLCLGGASGCSSYLFFPDRYQRITPADIGLVYEDVEVLGPDGRRLHAWWLAAALAEGPVAGTVLFLHGNAENMSTHIGSVAWMPAQGFQVLLLDYSGFGQSEGEPGVEVLLEDSEAALRLLVARPDVRGNCVAIFGQSMGAATALELARRVQGAVPLSAVIADSSFTSYRDIAQEKLALHWLTWAFQVPLSWTLPGSPRPIDAVAELTEVPLLLVHGELDPVVPLHHGQQLLAVAPAGTQLWIGAGAGHIETFAQRGMRRRLIEFLETSCALAPSPGESAVDDRARIDTHG